MGGGGGIFYFLVSIKGCSDTGRVVLHVIFIDLYGIYVSFYNINHCEISQLTW